MKRFIPFAVLLFAIAFYVTTEHVISQPTPAQLKRTPIHLWCTALPAKIISEFTHQFELRHPEYKVEIQTVAWNSLQEKTLWAVAAESNVPDLILGSSEWTGGLANNGALAPWDDYLSPEFFSQYFPGALGTYQFPYIDRKRPQARGEMRQYGIPFDLDMMLMFYRSDIVQPVMDRLGMTEFPTDWNDFSRLGRAVYSPRTLRGHSQNLIYLDPEDPVPVRMAFLPASGGKLFNNELTRADFVSPESIAAFTFMHDLIENRTAKEWNRGTQSDPMLLVKSERIVAYIAGPWYCKILESQLAEQAGKWRVALFPTRKPEYPCTGLGGSCLAMPYNARNKSGAVKLAQFLASEEFAIAYFKQVGSPPPLRAAWNNAEFDQPMPYFGNQKVYQVVRQAIDDSRPLQLLPNAQVMKQHLRWAMNEIMTRDANATETLTTAMQRANEALE
jgi:lactose/L-arabinose transport system substrate-binding protein